MSPHRPVIARTAIALVFASGIAGCTSGDGVGVAPAPQVVDDGAAATTNAVATTISEATSPTSAVVSTSTPDSPTTDTPTTTEPVRGGSAPPEWLGTRDLPLRPGETNGIAEPTPPELIDRRLWTEDVLPPPPSSEFVSSVTTPPPAHVVLRSTWREDCPVGLDDLSYAQVSFVGFDGLFHTGEFILHRDITPQVVEIFRRLHEIEFPIEEMRVTSQDAVDAHPTGDSNNTSSFVCRPAVNSNRWSRHAHGGAIDINPFHNPYVRGDLVIPELASAYLDRDRDVPGMITAEIAQLFADIGWGWGGNWNSSSDWMHFSDTGG